MNSDLSIIKSRLQQILHCTLYRIYCILAFFQPHVTQTNGRTLYIALRMVSCVHLNPRCLPTTEKSYLYRIVLPSTPTTNAHFEFKDRQVEPSVCKTLSMRVSLGEHILKKNHSKTDKVHDTKVKQWTSCTASEQPSSLSCNGSTGTARLPSTVYRVIAQ